MDNVLVRPAPVRLLAAFFSAALLLAPVPGAAAADGDPVVLNSCNLMYDNSSFTSTISGLDVQFTNNSSKAASVVNIQATINGSTEIIRDQGTFSPGIEIHHKYKSGGEQFALPVVLQNIFGGKPQVTCAIHSVKFADGTHWPGQSAQATAPNSSAINVSPTSITLRGSGASNTRLVLATGGGPLAMNSNCGGVADVGLLASTSRDIALRVTPKAAGSCTITIRDENDNVVTVPITSSP
jgi:hypothetical protein